MRERWKPKSGTKKEVVVIVQEKLNEDPAMGAGRRKRKLVNSRI